MNKKTAAKHLRQAVYRLVALACLALAWVPQAQASDYGCKVLLCLANPNGPMAVAECVPPISQLWDDLAHLRPFPSCDTAGDSYAKQGYSFYDNCPVGTNALSTGQYAVEGRPGVPFTPTLQQSVYKGIGEEGDTSMSGWQMTGGMPQKICVGNLLGQTMLTMGSGEDGHSESVNIYDHVAALDPQASPRFIDVFVNSTLYRRVRW